MKTNHDMQIKKYDWQTHQDTQPPVDEAGTSFSERQIPWLLFLHTWSASMLVCYYQTANMGATPKGSRTAGSRACPWIRTMGNGLSGCFLTPVTQTRLNIWMSSGLPCCHWPTCAASPESDCSGSSWAWHWCSSSSWVPISFRGTGKDFCSPPRPSSLELWLFRRAQQRLKFPLKMI